MKTTPLARAAIVALLFSRAALSQTAPAQPTAADTASTAQVLPQSPAFDRLDNGLGVVTVPLRTPGIVAYYTLVRTGSRDEVERGHSGFAHLFEHMMFRGSRTHSARDYEHAMQRMGADNNAYTTEDYTLYTVTIPSRSLDDLVPLEADRFANLSFSEQAFQTETRAVLGEYNKNSASPLHTMWESLSELAFTRHTYGHTTMGYLRDIEAMPGYFTYAQQFFRRYYTPDNCTLIFAGDVTREHALALARQHYSRWTGRRDHPVIPVEPRQIAPRSRALAWQGASPPRALIAYRIPAFSLDNDTAASLDVLHALSFSESSQLYQSLVVQHPKLLRLESWRGDFHRDPGLFVIEATLATGTTFNEIESAITAELSRVASGRLAPDEVSRVVSNLRYSMAMSAQTPPQAAQLIARFMALTGRADGYALHHTALSRVTSASVSRVASQYFTPTQRSIVTLSPAESAPPGAIRIGPNRGAATPTRSSVRTPVRAPAAVRPR